MGGKSRPIRVLMSTSRLAPRTNPYAAMLVGSLNELPDVQPEPFSWRIGMLGTYDVLHLHWPESRLQARTPMRSLVRQAMFTFIVLRARILRRPIVRTVHNIELPSGISRRERAILRLTERWTTLRIRLNDATPVAVGRPVVTIKHGDYRAWFADYTSSGRIRGRIVFFGLIRKYKAVPDLVRAFGEIEDTAGELSLHVSGHPSSQDLVERLETAAAADPRISLCLRRIDDAELVAEVSAAELIVLPYPEMHNSGAVLTTLSLQRPVLAPANEVNRQLAQEVGPGWLFDYAPPLTGAHISATLARLRALDPPPLPRLENRDWERIAAEHRTAYQRAIALRGRPSSRWRRLAR